MQVFDIQVEIIFTFIKCLCTTCGYELFVTRCRGHELHVDLNLIIYAPLKESTTFLHSD